MNINEWQNKQQISDAELAKNMGISISYLSRIKRGLRRLSPEKAEHTETITGGAVTVMELLFPEANDKGRGAQVSDKSAMSSKTANPA